MAEEQEAKHFNVSSLIVTVAGLLTGFMDEKALWDVMQPFGVIQSIKIRPTAETYRVLVTPT